LIVITRFMRVIQFRFWMENWIARTSRAMTERFQDQMENRINWVARIRGP
jgi:hypothetical protein